MGVGIWRRVAATLAVILGIGVAASAEAASAAPVKASSTTVSHVSTQPGAGRVAVQDWWWGP
jgi:hypothetical protein